MLIGSHVSFNSGQLLNSVKEAISYGANTFMFYTGAPQNTMRKPIDEELTKKAKELMKEFGINIDNVICHAPYIINLANKSNEEKWNFSINFLKQEIKRCESLGIKNIVLHPGSAVGITKEEGIKNISEGLNFIINEFTKCNILLETMAGKGTECGINTLEISSIINSIKYPEKIGVCLDTCHLFDSGIDLNNFQTYLDEFEKLVGINKIKCIHVNDSKNLLGSKKDRHENIGFGSIGFETLMSIINNPIFKNIPKILETPYVGDFEGDKNRIYPPYKFEIEMIKNNIFDSELIEKIRKFYK